MSALDKSLDDIISNTRKSNKVNIAKKKVGAKRTGSANRVGKKVGASTKKPVVSFKKSAPAAPKQPKNAVDLSYATKVVVYGLPKDIKLDAIKDFFQSQVGAVQNIALSYNEKGHFKGIATVIFKSNKSATLAVEKYNGAPIDGGSSKLKLELIIDPTKKPLTSRIAPNKVNAPKVSATKTKAKVRVQNGKSAPQQKPKKANVTKKPAKRVKKTVEELDQEMADYFN